MVSRHRLSALASAVLAGACLGGTATVASAAELSEKTRKQIADIEIENARRTPAEAKIASSLLGAIKAKSGRPVVKSVPSVRPMAVLTKGQKAPIEIRGSVTPALTSAITSAGGLVTGESQDGQTLTCLIDLDRITALANRPDVRAIKPILPERSHSIDSAGVIAHNAIPAQGASGAEGAGITVCVVSNGVDSRQAAIDRGSLPSIDVPPGLAGVGDEGTAMLEIVHAMAPQAPLGFATSKDATGFGTPIAMASHIRTLATSGCKIIVDDIGFPTESPFESGEVGRAIREVTDGGLLYFSAAGNDGNKNRNASSAWEGDFLSDGPSTEITIPLHLGGGTVRGDLLLFTPRVAGQPPNNLNNFVSLDDERREVTLFWSDRSDQLTSQYHIFAVNTAGDVVFYETDATQPVFLLIDRAYELTKGLGLAVLRVSQSQTPPPRFLHINAWSSKLTTSTNGAIMGHAASGAANEMTIGAVDASKALGPFTESQHLLAQDYSSDGPRRRFYAHDGKAFTPDNLTSTGGLKLLKPDFAAADCVRTDIPGFTRFCGTSAAAPHAAAIAALVWSKYPWLPAADVKTALRLSAIRPDSRSGIADDNPSWSETLGYGILMADAAVRQADAIAASRTQFLAHFHGSSGAAQLLAATDSTAIGTITPNDPRLTFSMTILTKDRRILTYYKSQTERYARGLTPDEMQDGSPPKIIDPVAVSMSGFSTTVRNRDGSTVEFEGMNLRHRFINRCTPEC